VVARRWLRLEIAFETQRLRTLCENNTKAARELGHAAAEQLKHRLADLRAAQSIRDLVASPPEQLEDPMEVSVAIGSGFHLLLRANHPETPIVKSGCVDWSTVERVKIMRIEKNG
jgi:toxin HigB-1